MSFSFIFPAVPRKVHIVLSESGVINIKQVPVAIFSGLIKLIVLGFSRQAVERIVSSILAKEGDQNLEEVLRIALSQL